MNAYKEFQFGWVIVISMVVVELLMTYLFINNIGDRPLDLTTYLIFTALAIVAGLFFYGLTTHIEDSVIKVSFGIGLITKKIELRRIERVHVVKSPWYYGWGIRLIPNGWMYNISGFDGIELEFKDTSRIFRIGSKNSVQLKKEIDKRVLSGI